MSRSQHKSTPVIFMTGMAYSISDDDHTVSQDVLGRKKTFPFKHLCLAQYTGSIHLCGFLRRQQDSVSKTQSERLLQKCHLANLVIQFGPWFATIFKKRDSLPQFIIFFFRAKRVGVFLRCVQSLENDSALPPLSIYK